jgi:hypothetical protein
MNDIQLTNVQVEILLHLVQNEMTGICGDVGYQELSQIRRILEAAQNKENG